MDRNNITPALTELKARIEAGTFTKEELVSLMNELSGMVEDLTAAIRDFNQQVEQAKRSQAEIEEYR